MLKLALGGGAGGGVLAHAHGGVALIHLAHFALLAAVAQAGICRNEKMEPSSEISEFTSLRLLQHKRFSIPEPKTRPL